VDLPAPATHEALGAREHLLRGATREGEDEDAVGINAAIDEMRDAIDKRAGLPRAGAGDDEERPVTVRRCGCLLGIQVGGDIPVGLGDDSTILSRAA